MALLHRATLSPSKPELLAAWLPTQPWAAGLGEWTQVGGYRIDDPGGEVGLEGIVLRGADGTVLHTPLTYRGTPLEGAEEHLLGTAEHSVLGTRWVYDAAGDPVWAEAVTATVLAGGTGAEEYVDQDGERVVREPSVRVAGSGRPAGETQRLEPVVVRRVGEAPPGQATLHGTWEGGEGVLVVLRSAGSR